jgi:hypothetical protein
VVGVSLGGNALLRWAQEAGRHRRATAARWPPSRSPIDLAAAGAAIDRGFNWLVYSRMFLASMKPKALAKWQQHPGLFDRDKLRRGAHAVRVRQRLHRAAARLQGHARLLGARIRQAAPGAHPHAGPGAQRAQRPLRAGGQPANGGRGRAASRCGSRRTAGTWAFRRALSGPRAGHAAGRGDWLATGLS